MDSAVGIGCLVFEEEEEEEEGLLLETFCGVFKFGMGTNASNLKLNLFLSLFKPNNFPSL